MTRRLKVGVVGAGVIAQVMHLHYLRELSDRFEIAAMCDISGENAANNAQRYHIAKTFSDWREMVNDDEIDAVFILTSGSHAPIAIEAAKAGKHILVEKPMCFSVAEGLEMKAAADAAGVTLMVAYPKRYDPAFERFREVALNVAEPRLMRVTTFESPFLPYIGHYSLAPVSPIPAEAIANFRAETAASITRAIGEANPFLRDEYHRFCWTPWCMRSTPSAAFSVSRRAWNTSTCRAVSSPSSSSSASLSVAIHWLDLPGITRYEMEFALYGPHERVTLSFPSPFLRSAPATVEIIEGEPGTTKSRSISETTSYASAFKLELEAFHDAVVNGKPPLTNAEDAIHDLALCEAIIRFVQDRQPIADPSAIPALASAN